MPRPIPLKHNNASPILLKYIASPDSSQTQQCLAGFLSNTTMPRPILLKHNNASPMLLKHNASLDSSQTQRLARFFSNTTLSRPMFRKSPSQSAP